MGRTAGLAIIEGARERAPRYPDAIRGSDRLAQGLGANMIWWESLKNAPLLLRILALASLFLGVGFPLSAFVPGSSFNLAGTLLPHEQVWSSRVALAIFASAPLLFAVGLGILFRRRWVRWPLIVLPVLQFLPFQVAHWYFGAPNPTPLFRHIFSNAAYGAQRPLLTSFFGRRQSSFFGEVRA
jgi:phosphotransferase system  glucose/maltose/N-acetylglucosamine-specific IIC component